MQFKWEKLSSKIETSVHNQNAYIENNWQLQIPQFEGFHDLSKK